MTLYFIGLGLHDEKDMSIKAVETAKKCDMLFAELYTQKMHYDIKKLESFLGKKIRLLTRKEVEENPDILLKPAKNKIVGFLVGGDPFCATTHTSLKLDCIKKKIKTDTIHSSSIFSAVGETGLHVYKFGQTVTVPFPDKYGNKLPLSIYDKIKQNQKLGLHTLILLDIDVEKGKLMDAKEGIEILMNMERERNEDIINENSEIVVFARAGDEKEAIVYDKVKKILKKNLGEPPMVIIIPGNLHFTEKECLEMFRK